MELKAEGQGTTQTFPSASAFLCLCSFGGCRKKLGLGVNEELPGEHTRQRHKCERVWNPCESMRKSKPSSMKCLVGSEPLPHSTGPILCCHPDLWLLPKLSKHWLGQSQCRKGDFPRQVLVASEEWETGKTCTGLLGHFGASWPTSKQRRFRLVGDSLSSISAGQKPQEFNTKAKDSLDPAKGLPHGSHSSVTGLWMHLLG